MGIYVCAFLGQRPLIQEELLSLGTQVTPTLDLPATIAWCSDLFTFCNCAMLRFVYFLRRSVWICFLFACFHVMLGWSKCSPVSSKKSSVLTLLVMGPGKKFLIQVRSIFCSSGWIRSAIYGLGLENSPFKCQIFQFFSFRIKKISSDWVKKYPGQRWVGLLFSAGVKSKLGSGQGPSLHSIFIISLVHTFYTNEY